MLTGSVSNNGDIGMKRIAILIKEIMWIEENKTINLTKKEQLNENHRNVKTGLCFDSIS